MVGLISAMAEELDLFKKECEIEQEVIQAGITFYLGSLAGRKVILLQSGVGKVNAAVATQLLIDRFGVESVIFTGLAGGLVSHLNVGDIVVASNVVQYDVDLTAFGRRVGEIPDLARMIEAYQKLVKSSAEAYDRLSSETKSERELVVGTIATGDSFISSSERIKWLQREFGAVAVDMEGGAVGQVCQMNRLPFVVIRVISDKAGNSAAGEFIFSLEDASLVTFNLVVFLLAEQVAVEI